MFQATFPGRRPAMEASTCREVAAVVARMGGRRHGDGRFRGLLEQGRGRPQPLGRISTSPTTLAVLSVAEAKVTVTASGDHQHGGCRSRPGYSRPSRSQQRNGQQSRKLSGIHPRATPQVEAQRRLAGSLARPCGCSWDRSAKGNPPPTGNEPQSVSPKRSP